MEDQKTTDEGGSFARSAGVWGLSVLVGCVVVVAWGPIIYRLGAENLSTSYPLAMGGAMFAATLSKHVFKKGVSESGWADVAQSIVIGAGIGAILWFL